MVKKLVILFSILLIGCHDTNKKESRTIQEQNSEVKKMIVEEYSEVKKEEQDSNYFNGLIELNTSDIEFLELLKYIIKSYQAGIFLDDDPILGKNEIIPSKNFTYPMPYAYNNIPKYNDLRVVLVCNKNKSVEYLAIKSSSGASRFMTHGNLNIIQALNLKFIKKDKPEFSNKIYIYYYTDGKFNYEIQAESSSDEEKYPIKFYSFLMKKVS
jgi:hypothetical protein